VSSLARNWALALFAALMRVAMRLLSPVVPQSRSAVVSAFPQTEGNGVEVASALLRRYDGEVIWLQEDRLPKEVADLVPQGLRLLPKASLAGVWAYLRAEVVFFTHGLYGSPQPCRRKPLVNVWHGDGPKDINPRNGAGELIRSTYLVGSTRLFSTFQADAFEVPTERLLLTGNPRTDQLWRPATRPALAELGISADFVLWMPTFRRQRAVGAVRTRPEVSSATDAGLEQLDGLVRGLRQRGIELVVKPHPMDADRRRGEGVVTVTEADLVRAGTSLYALLGQSRGLVTDYSSVWVDYLLLDRPMAFFVPDRDHYDRRLYPPDVLDWVPGEVVVPGPGAFDAFLADLDARGALGAERRAEVAGRIGLNRSREAADGLVDELATRGVLSLRAVDADGPSRRIGDRTSLLGRR
jgi:hypothetical protein